MLYPALSSTRIVCISHMSMCLLQVTAKPIPSAVFERAGLGSGDGEEGEGGGEDAVGALERLKKGKKSGT